MGETEVPIQKLRNYYKKLQAHNPKTDSSLAETEYGVGVYDQRGVVWVWLYAVVLCVCVCSV